MSAQRLPGGVVHNLPSDLRERLITSTVALDAWKDITPLARNEFICWVEDARQQKTRERRIRRTREERGGRGIRPHDERRRPFPGGTDYGRLIQGGATGRHREVARAGIEPATPRFSVVCSTN